jgi:hypothetical protein
MTEEKKIQLVWIDDEQNALVTAGNVIKRAGLDEEVNLMPILTSTMRENLEKLSNLPEEAIVFIDGLDGAFDRILGIVRVNNPNRRVCIVSSGDYSYKAGALGAEFYDKPELFFTDGMLRKVILNKEIK